VTLRLTTQELPYFIHHLTHTVCFSGSHVSQDGHYHKLHTAYGNVLQQAPLLNFTGLMAGTRGSNAKLYVGAHFGVCAMKEF
jgi:hypothetical protein